jgi:Tfp pilus assembly protein FimT
MVTLVILSILLGLSAPAMRVMASVERRNDARVAEERLKQSAAAKRVQRMETLVDTAGLLFITALPDGRVVRSRTLRGVRP